MVRRMTLFLGLVCICAMLRAEQLDGIRRLAPFERAVAIIKRFEGWHSARHYPYIGFGHRLREGEKLTADITEAQADSLLRADLAGMCALFRHLGEGLIIARLPGLPGRSVQAARSWRDTQKYPDKEAGIR